MATRLRGLNPLSYMGVDPVDPAQAVIYPRNPTINDCSNFTLQCQWLNSKTEQLWVLVNQAGNKATWKEIIGGGSGIQTIEGDIGGPVPGDGSSNLFLQGSGHYVFTGNPGANLITLSDDGAIATTYTADSGTATPSSNNLNIVGSGIISTSGSGDTITITAAGSVPVAIHTDSGNAIPSGGVLNVLGGNNITTTGSGNSIHAAVTGTTNHAVQIGNSTGSLTSLAVGTDGQVLIGATGANPAFSTLTSGDGSITFTVGANSLDLKAAGAGPGVTTIHTNSGNAAPSGGTLNVYGDSSHIQTTGAGNTVTAELYGFTDNAPVVGNASGSLDSLSPMTTGQLMIGRTGNTPNLARLIAGSNIAIDDTTTPGSITISSSGGGGGVIKTTFTSNGTWIKNSQTEYVYLQIWSGGGGGGSGTSGNGTPISTGSGGCGGSCIGASFYLLPASAFGATASVTIGLGGAGGAGVTSGGTGLYGNKGTTGAVSSVDDLTGGLPGLSVLSPGTAASPTFTALDVGGSGGVAGSFPITQPGCVFNNSSPMFYNTGAAVSINGVYSVDFGGAQPNGFTSYASYQGNVRPFLLGGGTYYYIPTPAGAPTSGGGGGGIFSGTPYSGGSGGGIWNVSGSYSVTGAAGAAASSGLPGTNGQDASAVAANGIFSGGLGGGGGANSGVNTNGTKGGNGGFPGGAGGGGGGCSLGFTSGAGGDGSNGYVVIYEFLSSGGSGGSTSQFFGASTPTVLNAPSGIQWTSPFGTINGMQSNVEFTMPVAGTISNLYVNVGDNASTTDCTVTLNKNGSNTSLAATITALTTGVFSDLTHSVSVNVGDTIQFELGASTVGFTQGTISCKFISSNGSGSTVQQIAGSGVQSNFNNTSAVQRFTLYSDSGNISNEPYYVMPTSGTFSRLFVYVVSNAATNTNTITLLVNGVATSLVVSYGAGLTGVFSNLVDTVAVNTGDLIQFESSQSVTGDAKGSISIIFES